MIFKERPLKYQLMGIALLALSWAGFGLQAQDSYQPHGGMLRFPDVSQSHIVFLYGNDLWQVSRTGGTATLVAAPEGAERMPRYSPDGETIAFMGNYDGNTDIYTIPAAGGIPQRITFHPGTENLDDWSPDGTSLLFFAGSFGSHPRVEQAFKIPAAGGTAEKFPLPYGTRLALSPDATWLAYTPTTRDHRTWKRYRGGMAADIWLFNLNDFSSRQITDWEGTDSFPMWHGDKLYYLSDQGDAHRLNIWMVDPASGDRRQITNHTDYDVKYPAIGPGADGGGEIVYQYGSGLHLLNLQTEQTKPVSITLPGARANLRPLLKDASEHINGGHISPTGQRLVLEGRGDLWSLPAKQGSVRNMTHTSGVAERDPAWSPDGAHIAYFSDESGEYQLYVRKADGSGQAKKLSDLPPTFLLSPVWSPDSKHIAFTDKAGKLFLAAADGSSLKQVYADINGNRLVPSWSNDSSWLAFVTSGNNLLGRIVLYSLADDTATQVTSGMYNDNAVAFDREGKYLYFSSDREITSPLYESLGSTWIYTQTARMFAVPLRADVAAPGLAKSDEEPVQSAADTNKDSDKDTDKDTDKDDKNKDDAADKPAALVIDLDGFESRAVMLPVERGSFGSLAINDQNHLIYVRRPLSVGGAPPSIQYFDPHGDKPEEKTVLDSSGTMVISADGKKLAVSARGKYAVIDARPGKKIEDAAPTNAMQVTIDPRAEWQQLFNEAWRLFRDYFYDPNMHGVDWPAVREQYAAMLADCTTREDVQFVIQEMISELNVGHAYYRGGGDYEATRDVAVGLLGADFSLENGAFRFAKLYNGGPWDAQVRNPLTVSGVDVAEGDYLLAVNGQPMDTSRDPFAAFQGLAGHTVTLRVSKQPTDDAAARDVVVQTLRSDASLRLADFIENKRAYVDQQTDGQVGYIYVQNTGVSGQNDLVRQFYGQTDKKALIIDERWNGGGQIPTRFIELLNRPLVNMWAIRDGRDFKWPYDAHHGPKCMLINGRAGSGGDYFPYWFKKSGLGKLIGTRTWGGLVGISGNPSLIDGGNISVPTFAFYEEDSTWGIEGHGVDPDMEVIDDPALMADGGDPQLDAAIAHMLEEIANNPFVRPPRPAYPDRSGMGIPEEDQ